MKDKRILKKTPIGKIYPIYYNIDTKVVKILTKIPVKHLRIVRYELKVNRYDYSNIIIGRPDV